MCLSIKKFKLELELESKLRVEFNGDYDLFSS